MTMDCMIKMVCMTSLLLALPVFAAHGVNVAELPDSEFADTEVVTNVVLSLSCDDISRLQLTIDLEASPSNNVEVAVGHDADGDGSLSLDESAFAVGYDCGEWFTLLAASDAVTCEPVSDSGTFHRVYSIRAVNVDPLWNLAKITRRGFGYAGETVVVELVSSGFMLKML